MEELQKKHFQDGVCFQNFQMNFLVNLIYVCPQANNRKNFLTKLGARKVKFFGNLKYSQSEKEISKINNFIKKRF